MRRHFSAVVSPPSPVGFPHPLEVQTRVGRHGVKALDAGPRLRHLGRACIPVWSLALALTTLVSPWHPARAAPPADAPPPVAAPATPAPAGHRDLAWDELVPKDWDPLKQFKNLPLDKLQDNDPEAARLLKRLRATWDNAPTNRHLAGAKIRIPGFLVPLEESAGGVKEFLLVPYFGACIHSPPPPANQIIHVLPQTPVPGGRAMDTVWVSGTLSLGRTDSEMGVSGYQLQAIKVEPYVEPKRR